jgi:hypothetical protein
MGAVRFGVGRSSANPGAFLEPALNRFKPLQGIEQLKADFTGLVCALPELLGMFNGEPDPVDSNARLVRHLEFNG